MKLLNKLLGDESKRYLKKVQPRVEAINAAEERYSSLSDEEIKAASVALKTRVIEALTGIQPSVDALLTDIAHTADEAQKAGFKIKLRDLKNEALNELATDAFSLVREAAKRTLNQRHYDVQLIGGMSLHEGQVAEMKTGEGKTLTSTLAIYLNALSGDGVHVVTVNDYLAKRDAVWMGQIFDFLGLSVGIITHEGSFVYDSTQENADSDETRDEGVAVEDTYLRSVSKKEAYQADITYGTNNEFGFDYLRDNMVRSLEEKVQRKLNYAIIDEVDSILIDEARTPLIISAPDTRPTSRYYQFAEIVKTLSKETDFTVDEKQRAVTLTEDGMQKVEKALGVENLYVEEGIQTVHHIEQALKAQVLFTKEKDYTIKDDSVVIVDEFTGRLLAGRRYSEGLHQAIEAKEGVTIQQESKTMATITFQNYFRLYDKIAGMTGTAETEAEELGKIYGLDVTVIPTNKPIARKDLPDQIYKNERAKYAAVVQEIKQRNEAGQPVLVGTISIEKNEYLSELLRKEGIEFNMLNAKQHEREAHIIAEAGTRKAVTIATNMAGRGVDIKLGGLDAEKDQYEDILNRGGLHVIGTERHESRRIDNQLRGRSGRQGDAGSSQFFVSLEDDLMRIFGGERAQSLMKSWPDSMPIQNPIISKSIESAQKKVEGHNFDIRKHLVEYDDVANKQRMHIYVKRDGILNKFEKEPEQLISEALGEVNQEIENTILGMTHLESVGEWPKKQLIATIKVLSHPTHAELHALETLLKSDGTAASIRSQFIETAKSAAKRRLDTITEQSETLKTEDAPYPLASIIKELYLRSIDLLWIEHLETMQYLRTGIGLRGYGQRDPVVEYKRESKDLFNQMISGISRQFVNSLLNVQLTQNAQKQMESRSHEETERLREEKARLSSFDSAAERSNTPDIESKPRNQSGEKIGRNDPCYCGSGKKFKKCHGA